MNREDRTGAEQAVACARSSRDVPRTCYCGQALEGCRRAHCSRCGVRLPVVDVGKRALGRWM